MRSSLRFKMAALACLAIGSVCLAADWSVVVGARSGRVVGEHAKVLAESVHEDFDMIEEKLKKTEIESPDKKRRKKQ